MTPREFYEFLAKRETTGVIGFGEAAVSLRVGPQDAMAARLLLWLEAEMLDAAKWWSTFWASLERAKCLTG